ncbi:MAG: hypothetical protein LAT81_13605, partial [Oceanicaulis sp.]|nr:hypothetical protein [Oceanicaulis sp.]
GGPNDDCVRGAPRQYANNRGGGPPGQNHVNGSGICGLLPRDSFHFSIYEPGEFNNTAMGVMAEANLRVAFGDGAQLPAMLGPAPLGGTFSALNKGRVIGLELRVRR